LRVVTARENSLAPTSNSMGARNSRRLNCPKCGGEYSKFANGVRYCPVCRHTTMMAYQRWRRAEKKAGRPGLRRDYKE
jgi:protein-arginine kinase activator protein McsA